MATRLKYLPILGVLMVVLLLARCRATTGEGTASEPASTDAAAAAAEAAPTTAAPRPLDAVTRFTGHAQAPGSGAAIPLTIDLVREGERLRAVATWQDGAAYVSSARLDAATGSLLDDAAYPALQDTAIHGDRISGRLRGLPFEARRTDLHAAAPARVQKPLDAVYAGTCDGATRGLVIVTTRGHARPRRLAAAAADDPVLPATALGGHADAFVEGAPACTEARACLEARYELSAFDAATRTLTLSNALATRRCTVEGDADALSCDGCRMPRRAEPAIAAASPAARTTAFDAAVAQDPTAARSEAPAPAEAGLDPGQYYGYLWHTDGRAQLLALNVETAGAAQASLYFGEGDSDEMVVHDLRGGAVLEGEGDAMLVIERADARGVRGRLVSKSRGHAGPFSLRAGLVPDLSPDVPRVPALSGVYASAAWTFELAASANVSAAAGEASPLHVYGWAQENLATARRRRIVGGTYDVYANAIAIELDDGRTVSGSLVPAGMRLRWPAPARAGAAMTLPVPQNFSIIEHISQRRADLSLP